jgi:hypothetical protein
MGSIVKAAASTALALAAFGLLPAGTARAQSVSRGFALDRFLPSASGSDWFAGDSLRIEGNLRPVFGVGADYDVDPLVLYNADGSRRAAPVKGQLFLRMGASMSVWDRYRISADLPISPYQSGESGVFNGESVTAPRSGGIGDLALAVDVRLLGRYGQPFTLGAGVQLFLPTGSSDNFLGEGSVRAMPRVAAAGTVGIFMYSAQIGLMLREQRAFAGVDRGTDLTFAAAGGVAVLDRRLIVGPEVYGATGVGQWAGASAFKQLPVEALLGAHYRVTAEWRIGATGAVGVSKGLGSPAERALLTTDWSPTIGQRHHVPVTIELVQAPPPPPPAPLPALVKAPDPVGDRDGDLVLDDVDACADLFGVATANPKTTGCPAVLADTDNDGILDTFDACPNVVGVASDDPALRGCPPRAAPPPIAEKIFFAAGIADLGPASVDVLGRLALTLKGAPTIRLIIDGHSDDQGKEAFNQDLSHRRAEAAVEWLIAHGVAAQQLQVHWFGAQRPAQPHHDAVSRQANRRVELHEESPLTLR